jgi:hypothetical protein
MSAAGRGRVRRAESPLGEVEEGTEEGVTLGTYLRYLSVLR